MEGDVNRHARTVVLFALTIMVGACGDADETEPAGAAASTTTSTTAAVTTSGPPAAPVSTSAPSTTQGPADSEAVADYLVALANLEADQGDFLSGNEEACSELHQGEEEPTGEQYVEIGHCFLTGLIEGASQHVSALDALTAPGGFEEAHAAYIAAYQSWAEQLVGDSAALTEPDDIDDYLAMIFFGFEPTPPIAAAMTAIATGCMNLQQLGVSAGYAAELSCPLAPAPAPEPIALDVQVGGPWVADPNPLAVTDGDIQVTLRNVGAEPIRPVIIDVFEGDPNNLPIVNGVVDLSLSGVGDPDSGLASFGVQYPDVFTGDDSNVGEVPLLASGASTETTLSASDVLVVFDYRQDEFEAGSRVVIERQ